MRGALLHLAVQQYPCLEKQWYLSPEGGISIHQPRDSTWAAGDVSVTVAGRAWGWVQIATKSLEIISLHSFSVDLVCKCSITPCLDCACSSVVCKDPLRSHCGGSCSSTSCRKFLIFCPFCTVNPGLLHSDPKTILHQWALTGLKVVKTMCLQIIQRKQNYCWEFVPPSECATILDTALFKYPFLDHIMLISSKTRERCKQKWQPALLALEKTAWIKVRDSEKYKDCPRREMSECVPHDSAACWYLQDQFLSRWTPSLASE